MVAQRGSYEFFLQMKKKPALQQILDCLEDMSFEEINECDQPLWIRQHLIRKKKEDNPDYIYNIERIADTMMNEISDIPTYLVCEYLGEQKFVGNKNATQIEAYPGDLFQIMCDKIMWGTMPLNKLTTEDIGWIRANSKDVGKMTSIEYRFEMQKRLKSKYNITEEIPVDKITSNQVRVDGVELLNKTVASFPVTIRKH